LIFDKVKINNDKRCNIKLSRVRKHLQQKVLPDQDITHTLDYEGLMDGIKKWPECTTMSPSGCHLGIYKTLRKYVMEKKK